MSNDVHESIRAWLLEGEAQPEQQRAMREHLATCAECSRFAERMQLVAAAVKGTTVTADAALVAATRHRLHRQALLLAERRAETRLLAFGFSVMLLWVPLSAGVWWIGGGWIGSALHVPSLVWQMVAAMSAFLPLFLAAAAWLARRDHEGERLPER